MDKETARTILATLRRHYRNASLHPPDRGTPFEILILTILSAQTTDRAVDALRAPLFSRYPTPHAMAHARSREVEAIIRTIGLYRAKAGHITGAARMIEREFGGQVPQRMEALLKLPGVGRKTANIVLSHAFGINEGIAVDTHVKRIAYRTGMTGHTDPGTIERDLMGLFDMSFWGEINSLLVRHGRTICTARSPQCNACPIHHYCRYFREVYKDPPSAKET